jgi:hypothetical protein
MTRLFTAAMGRDNTAYVVFEAQTPEQQVDDPLGDPSCERRSF